MSPVRRSDARTRTPADEVLSAVVIVRAASGRRLAGSKPIDTTTLPGHRASASDVATAQQGCAARGFSVGDYVGISFAITAARSVFEQQFGVQLDRDAGGDIHVVHDGKPLGLELPLDRLPASLRKVIDTVTFTPRVELHGTGTML